MLRPIDPSSANHAKGPQQRIQAPPSLEIGTVAHGKASSATFSLRCRQADLRATRGTPKAAGRSARCCLRADPADLAEPLRKIAVNHSPVLVVLLADESRRVW